MATTFIGKAETAANVTFQQMCYVAMSLVAQDILNDGGASVERKAWGRRVMVNQLTIGPTQAAQMCLRNAAVGNLTSGGGVNSQDADMITSVLEQLDNFVAIG